MKSHGSRSQATMGVSGLWNKKGDGFLKGYVYSLLALKMMDPAKIEPGSFGTVFSTGFKIGIEKKMIILGKMINQSRTDSQNPLPGMGNIITIHLGISNLFPDENRLS